MLRLWSYWKRLVKRLLLGTAMLLSFLEAETCHRYCCCWQVSPELQLRKSLLGSELQLL